jgi:rhodanese-related sulfurtransferase
LNFASIDAAALKAALRDGAELALLDAREQGAFSEGHLLLASCLPLSWIEMRITRIVPRPSCRVICCDGAGDGLAQRAAQRLIELGYGDVQVLDGGVAAWRAAGYEVFTGVNVPSKAFGEYVEHRDQTPFWSAAELAARQAAGERLLILDSRPFDEYQRVSIPGGIDCPGAELVYRAFDLLPDRHTSVVVNCAGRTRSIIGAQSLISAGLPNPVRALKDGTMGWQLAGLDPVHGADRIAPPPRAAGRDRARAAAREVAQRSGVRAIDAKQLETWRAERHRTTYLFDVRSHEEHRAGRPSGARFAPGGQLVQATDDYVAVRHARLVLYDDQAARADMTAAWLRQMGWSEVYTLTSYDGELVQGAVDETPTDFAPAVSVAPRVAAADVQAGRCAVLDLRSSTAYQREHIAGAWWGVRARLAQALAALPDQQDLLLCGDESLLVHYAAADLRALGRRARVLTGGPPDWAAAGLAIAAGADRATTTPDDVWLKPYERPHADAMRDYLAWELQLPAQIARDGDLQFR